MNLLKYAVGLVFVAGLTACGGGGGSAGTTSGGGTPGVVVSAYPTLSGVLQDASGSATSSVSASGYTVLRVALTDPSGKGIPDQVVSATADETKVVFPEGSGGLTNAAGVATIKVARASLFATGADTLTVTYNYRAGSFTRYPNGSVPPSTDKVVANYVGYQLSASNITLTNLNIGSPNLAAYGTRQVSVQANINGAAVSSTPVQVSFSANCGSVTPATASTNSQGVVQVSYSATNPSVPNDQGCSGSNVSIVASTTGATPVSGSLSIDVAPATNLVFVDATPTTIFLSGSGGATQSVVKFRLINASNSALQGQNILLELKDLSGGIPKTSFGTVGNTAAITQPTNSGGEVSVPVFSGTVPTNVSVKATLISNGAVTTTSAMLAIASGRAVQSRTSLAVKELSIEGANLDGVTTQVTMSLADRQGNPVPDGTAINFVTEGGVMIPPFCTTLKSTCTVDLRSQNPRPVDGRVSVLAYAAGEEDFSDLNFDNTYTLGEPFADLGNAFRQDAALVGGGQDDALVGGGSGSYVEGYFSVPRAGQTACNGGFLGRPNSCDGVWGAVDVRQQAVVIFATGPAVISAVSQTTSNLTFSVADGYSNSVPTGSVIDVTSSSDFCSIASGRSAIVANSLYPAVFSVAYSANGSPCAGGTLINVKLTTPRGTVTTKSFAVPATAAPELTVLSGTSMTVLSANSRTTIVSGGTAPYSVSSSAPDVARATLSSNTLVIEGVAPGTSTVIISDAAGAMYSIAVKVTGP